MRTFLIGVIAVAAMATPAVAETWNPYSRTAVRAYLADVDSIVAVDGVTSIRAASTAMTAAAGDLGHTRETYQFRCEAAKWRTAGATDYEADGSEGETYPEEDAPWEDIRQNTLPDYLKQIACDGSRAQGATWPSVTAFIQAGRPAAR